VPGDHLLRAGDRVIAALSKAARGRMSKSSGLIFDVTASRFEPAVIDETTRRIAAIRASPEGPRRRHRSRQAQA